MLCERVAHGRGGQLRTQYRQNRGAYGRVVGRTRRQQTAAVEDCERIGPLYSQRQVVQRNDH